MGGKRAARGWKGHIRARKALRGGRVSVCPAGHIHRAPERGGVVDGRVDGIVDGCFVQLPRKRVMAPDDHSSAVTGGRVVGWMTWRSLGDCR